MRDPYGMNRCVRSSDGYFCLGGFLYFVAEPVVVVVDGAVSDGVGSGG